MVTKEFAKKVAEKSQADTWVPAREHSVFGGYDASYYEANRGAFIHKYRVIKNATALLEPESIVELGSSHGPGTNAMLTGVDWKATYVGYDSYGPTTNEQGEPWDPVVIMKSMFQANNFERYNLEMCDLRQVESIPSADLCFVDAMHDYRGCYQDTLLAIRAKCKHILIDDYHGEEVKFAVEDICNNYRDEVRQVCYLEHLSGLVLLERV